MHQETQVMRTRHQMLRQVRTKISRRSDDEKVHLWFFAAL